MHTTVVMNAKGGVGKTTITTNLASYFASRKIPTTIMDYDPQGSSLRWLEQRPATAPPIHRANGAPRKGPGLKSLGRIVPRETRQLILDAPAGPPRLLMQELLDRSDAILIPVAPSRIDIHATANFIKELLLTCCTRHQGIRVAVIANRVRASTAVYEPLERFVASLKLTFIAHLRDSEVYVEAGDSGYGIFEIDTPESRARQHEFMPIIDWVDRDRDRDRRARMPSESNVIPLVQSIT